MPDFWVALQAVQQQCSPDTLPLIRLKDQDILDVEDGLPAADGPEKADEFIALPGGENKERGVCCPVELLRLCGVGRSARVAVESQKLRDAGYYSGLVRNHHISPLILFCN